VRNIFSFCVLELDVHVGIYVLSSFVVYSFDKFDSTKIIKTYVPKAGGMFLRGYPHRLVGAEWPPHRSAGGGMKKSEEE